MNVSKIAVGVLQANCYLLEKNGFSLIIDSGAEYEKVKEFVKNKKLVGILLTHHHFDHVGCVNDLVNDYGVSVYDDSNLNEGMNEISIFSFEVIKTYGHTMDSISFYFDKEKVMFTGDFLFYDTIGRCDFPESNYNEMLKSIEKIKGYPNEVVVYPGHGMETSLGREKQYNYYFE